MSKKLTQKKLDSLFACYCEKQSVNNVAKTCKVSHTTVKKYKILLEWDKRLKGVQEKAIEKQDNSLAESIAENLKYVQFVKAKIIELITQKDGVIKSTNTMADLDRAIRLELLLRGEADSRVENLDGKLKNVSTDELVKMRKQLEKNASDDAGN